jgi:hypothetical protein
MIEALHSLYIREKVLESKIVTLLGVHAYINTSWINGSLERRKKSGRRFYLIGNAGSLLHPICSFFANQLGNLF